MIYKALNLIYAVRRCTAAGLNLFIKLTSALSGEIKNFFL